MRFLRTVKGCTREDQIRNDHIRQELNITESLNNNISYYIGEWFIQIGRMETDAILNRVLNYILKGKRCLERSCHFAVQVSPPQRRILHK